MAVELDKIFTRSRSHLVYAVISVACPFLAGIAMHFYQQEAWTEFGRSSSTAAEDANNFADAMLGMALFIDFVLAVAFGSLIGMIFAVVSIRKVRRWISIATLAFLFNAIPACFVFYKILTTW